MSAPQPPAALHLDGLVISIDGNAVLDGVDLEVAQREVIAIQGSSGAGKSTLLAAVAGLIRPDAGQISIDGERVDHLVDRRRSTHRLERLGVIFQTDELLPELSLGENITLPLQLIGHKRRAGELVPLVSELVGHLGIADLLDRSPQDVSGGQLQRAAIARALSHQPVLVLADEPTAALDETSARTAVQLLVRLAKERGTSVILVTHDSAVARMCDRVLFLDGGRLVAPVTRP